MNGSPTLEPMPEENAGPTTILRRRHVPWALLTGLVVALFAVSPAYACHLLVMVGIYLLLTYSLNIVMGFGGLIIFCHAAFYGVGAYTYALARLNWELAGPQATELLWTGGWAFLPAVLLAVVAGAILGGAVGWICLRFRGDQFVFATIGFQMIIFVVLYNWVGFGRGPSGIYGIPRPSIFGREISTPWAYAVLVGGFVAVVLPLVFRLCRSQFGLALRAMREDERAARAMGLDTDRLALQAMVVAGGIAGLAGALYAGYTTYIDPSSFSLEESIFLVTMLMLGGRGSMLGPLIGVIVMLALPELLRFAGLPDEVAANTRKIIYGVMLAAFIYWRPQGLAGRSTKSP